MAREKQNEILDNKIKSNNNQYKIDRLNAKISALSSGDLNKYEFLTRKDLNYKPDALDKVRFEFSPLGRSFNRGLDKTIPNYQEEGIIKLLKEIRDNLAGRKNISERLMIPPPPPPAAKDTRSSFDEINKKESISNQKLNEIKIKIGNKIGDMFFGSDEILRMNINVEERLLKIDYDIIKCLNNKLKDDNLSVIE